MSKASRNRPAADIAAIVEYHLGRAIEIFGSERALALRIGISQQNMNRIVRKGQVSPQVAIGIHRETQGKVTGNQLRPDLWRRPSHVPVS